MDSCLQQALKANVAPLTRRPTTAAGKCDAKTGAVGAGSFAKVQKIALTIADLEGL